MNRSSSPESVRYVSVNIVVRTELERRYDPLAGEPQSFGAGFELQIEQKLFGPRLRPSATAVPAARSTAPGPPSASASPTP
jgi:hypothetical protein